MMRTQYSRLTGSGVASSMGTRMSQVVRSMTHTSCGRVRAGAGGRQGGGGRKGVGGCRRVAGGHALKAPLACGIGSRSLRCAKLALLVSMRTCTQSRARRLAPQAAAATQLVRAWLPCAMLLAHWLPYSLLQTHVPSPHPALAQPLSHLACAGPPLVNPHETSPPAPNKLKSV